MAVEETEFTQVFRGYDKDEVDKALGGLRRDIIAANTQAADAAKENKRLLARIEARDSSAVGKVDLVPVWFAPGGSSDRPGIP